MKFALVASSSILILAGPVPYISDIVRGRTKPRLVSWFIWAVLVGIASAAAFATHQFPAAALALCNMLQCTLVVVLGYKHSDRSLGRLDVTCLVGALAALGLWSVLKSPTLAALTIVATDLIAAVPTFIHSWRRPYEETWLAFALSGVAGVLTLLAANFAVVTAIVYPLYIALADLTVTLLLLLSPHRTRPNDEPSPTLSSG